MTSSSWEAGEQWDLPDFIRKLFTQSGFGPDLRRGPGPGPGPRSGHRTGGWAPPGRPGPDWGPWGPAFGLGGPGGPGGPGGRWRPRGPRAGRGDVRSAVLALLAEEPMHGYQIIQEIGRRSGGSWRPSPGSVYPTLQQLEDEGLVRAQEQDGRRVYRLTEAGEQLATDRAEEFAGLWQGVAPGEEDRELGDLAFGVASAFATLLRSGTPAQLAKARTVLARTKSELYRILGEEGADNRETP